MNKNKLIKKLSKELWDKSSWRFGAYLEEEYHNIFDDIAEDTVELLIEQDLLKDNMVYPPQYACFNEVFEEDEYKCGKCGACVFEEQPYCANCGAKLKE